MGFSLFNIFCQNGPLFFRCKRREDPATTHHAASPLSPVGGTNPQMTDLQYSFIVSSALDIVEERVQMGHQAFKGGNPALAAAGGVALSSGDGPQVATRELYLGALTAQEEYKV